MTHHTSLRKMVAIDKKICSVYRERFSGAVAQKTAAPGSRNKRNKTNGFGSQ
jgi:hypothetical protein